MPDQPEPRTEVHVLCVHLEPDETHDLFITWVNLPRKQNAYRLLTPKGQYVRTNNNEPVTCDDWHAATALCKVNGAAFIVCLHKGTVLFWHEPHGAWRTAVIYPHPDFEQQYHGSTIIRGDHNERKHKLSGAQRRKRQQAEKEQRDAESNALTKERKRAHTRAKR